MVNNVEKYFKNSLNIGNAFQRNNANGNNSNGNNNNAYGIISFLKGNIFYFVLFVFVVLIIVYAIHLIRRKVNKGGLTTIKSDYQVYRVDNDIVHNPVNNSQIECPSNLSKYSFAFFIELDDFYCNEGYWRALMVKGHEMNRANSLCTGGSFGEVDYFDQLLIKIGDDDIQDYLNDNKKVRKIDVDSFSKRLQLVCKTLEKGKVDEVCDLNEKHKIFYKHNEQKGEDINMSKGQCLNFFKEHETYCTNVYKTDKKVARNRDSTDTDMTKDRKFDNYDNICSDDNLREKFPELLPRNLSALKDVELINLAEKLDVKNGEDKENQTNLEGCYNFEPSKFDISKFEDETTNLNDREVNLNNCNNVAVGKSNYFGLANNGSENICYTLKITEENNLGDKQEGKCDNRKGNNDGGQHIYLSKSLRPEENILRKCWEDLINTYPIQNPGVWLHPFINDLRIVVTTKSDTDNYEVYQNENLHPYQNKNNFTVNEKVGFSDEDVRVLRQEYNEKLELIEKDIENLNMRILKLDTSQDNTDIITDIANKINSLLGKKNQLKVEYEGKMNKISDQANLGLSKDKCDYKDNTNQHYYREYFDVKNIPIKEKFHLAIVINEKLVEVFINGQLHTSQILFGNPEYNSGPLHISPGRKVTDQKLDLHGIITDFKYFRRSLTFNQIRSILKEKSFKDFDNAVVMPEEHDHKVEVVHEHPHDVVNEGDHKHNVDESNIKPEFYLEE